MIAESFFRPASVVIVGASDKAGRIGSGLVEAMLSGGSELFFVNPNHDRLFDRVCYHSLRELPFPPSHAFIAVSRDHVLPYLRECEAIGIKNVVIISSGFKEKDATGAALEEEIRALSQRSGITLLGPNTLGFLDTSSGFNGTFLPASHRRGPVSVISQSGGVGMALLSALDDQRCGISKWIGIGNEAGLTALEALEFLAQDEETSAIAVCFEGLRELTAFLRRAEEVNRHKPVILLRDGKSDTGLRAAASHTGALVYGGSVLPSLFRQFHLLEASTVRDCAVMLKALCVAHVANGNRAVILTNTAGPSVLAADTMETMGIMLPPVSEQLRSSIDEEAGVAMQLNNPADISSNGLSPQRYGLAAERLLNSDEYDLLLGFFSLNRHLMLPEKELIAAAQKSGKTVVSCFLSSQQAFLSYPLTIEEAGIPCYCDAHDAAVACGAICAWSEARREKTVEPAVGRVRQLPVAKAFLEAQDTQILSERLSKELFSLVGIDVIIPSRADTPAVAAAAAESLGFPVVLKLESSVITHKSAVGGVRLGLFCREAVLEESAQMLAQLRKVDPDATLTVQPMGGEGFDLIIGAVRSPLGVLLMVGLGGSFAEALADDAFCVLPSDIPTVRAMLRSLRCAGVLYAPDGIPRFPEEKLFSLLDKLGSLILSFPSLQELEINPCRITKDSLCVLDARAVLSL